MSIERDYDKYVMTCDVCQDTMPAEDEYNDTLHEAKRAGWKTKYVRGEWINACPACAKEVEE